MNYIRNPNLFGIGVFIAGDYAYIGMLLSKANVQLSDTEILVNERGDKITLEIPNKVLPTKSYNVKLKVLKLTLNDNEQ